MFRNPEKSLILVNASTSEPGLTNNALGSHNLPQIMPNRDSTMKKLAMLVFDGKNLRGWIARCERFFRHRRFSDAKKLELVSMSLEDLC